MTTDNALGLFFLGVVEYKLGRNAAASEHLREAHRCLTESAFWRARFQALKIEQAIFAYKVLVANFGHSPIMENNDDIRRS